MPAGKSSRNGSAHGGANQVDSTLDSENVEKFNQLPVKERAIVTGGGAVRVAASEKVVPQDPESGLRQSLEHSIPKVSGYGETVNQHHHRRIRGPGQFVVHQTG